jgi:hypothetical protein
MRSGSWDGHYDWKKGDKNFAQKYFRWDVNILVTLTLENSAHFFWVSCRTLIAAILKVVKNSTMFVLIKKNMSNTVEILSKTVKIMSESEEIMSKSVNLNKIERS